VRCISVRAARYDGVIAFYREFGKGSPMPPNPLR
jgi:hypothetical protein